MRNNQEIQQRKVTAQISHLIRILVDNLQKDPFAPVREYISNSHDACLGIENPTIQIWGEGTRLCIKDNGRGMTKKVIEEAFTRIAGHLNQTEDFDTIGMFGIGVLSAFIVAEKLEVTTRSLAEPHGWRLVWKRYADNFILEPIQIDDRGTLVIMHLDDYSLDLASNHELKGYINRTFALFDTPIFGSRLSDGPLNQYANWVLQIGSERKKGQGYLIKDSNFNGVMGKFSRHRLMIGYFCELDDGTRMYLGIPDQESSPIVKKDAITFCSQGIYVHGNIRAFFPENLSFIVGLIDSPNFKLQITREEIFLQDPHFEKIQKSIEFHIMRFLELLAEQDTSLVEETLRIHRAKLVAHGKDSPRLCNLFKQYYKFITSAGSIRWREILPYASQKGEDKIIYITASEIEAWKDVNSRSHKGFLTVYAFGAEQLILQHIAKNDNVLLRDVAEIETNGEVKDVPEPFRRLGNILSRHLGKKNIRAVVFIHDPGKIPAMFRIRTSQGTFMYPVGGESIPKHSYTIDGMMINIAHPIIRRLAGKANLSRKMYDKIADVLFQIAVLNSPFNDLWMSSKEEVIDNLVESLEVRIGLKKRPIEEIEGAADCFVALPYCKEFQQVWDGVEKVLSQGPYNWKVIRADRAIQVNFLLDNIKSLVKTSQRFLADISNLNANVLIEVGLMLENDADGLLIICDEETQQQLPADLQGKLLLVYPAELRQNLDQFSAFIAEKIKAYTEWISLTGVPMVNIVSENSI